MLGWFKKKFGKKDADLTQEPADLKIPVAPRPVSSQPLAEVTVTPQEEPILPQEEAAEPAADAVSMELPAELPEQEEEVNVSPAEELVVEETREQEPALPQEEPSTLIAAREEAVVKPEPVAEEPAQDESPGLTAAIPTETPEEDLTSIIAEPTPEDEVVATEATVVDEEEIEDREELSLPAEPETEEETVVPLPPPKTAAAPVEEKKSTQKKKSFLTRLAERLSRTRETFTYQLDTLFLGKKEIDAKLLDDLEELLITADLGLNVTQDILDHARRKLKRKELSDPNSLKLALKEKLKSFILDYQEDATLVMPDEGPFVIMVVGVNGVGKTTTIGKIAHKFLRANQSVLLVAADTFRAAAVSQLKIWGERNNVQVISKQEGADPSAVVYDGIAHAKAKGYDVVLVDTAGRLHTQANLMEELKKIKRVMAKQLDGAPHEVMLVIDATTGQNGISQAKLFNEAVALTGITLTKLDGTAKGGIVINICRELKLPIRFIGVGEQLDDLRDFDPDEFIEALFHSADASQQ